MDTNRPIRRNRRPTAPGEILREHYLVPRKILQKISPAISRSAKNI